jgi:hypothetical protein
MVGGGITVSISLSSRFISSGLGWRARFLSFLSFRLLLSSSEDVSLGEGDRRLLVFLLDFLCLGELRQELYLVNEDSKWKQTYSSLAGALGEGGQIFTVRASR